MIAVDTNVLVYAVDSVDQAKSQKAVGLLRVLESTPTMLLWQVACEFGAVMHPWRLSGKAHVDAQRLTDAWSAIFPLAVPSSVALRAGWRLARDLKMSDWDGMLIGACTEAGVETLYTEDLQGSPVLDGVSLVNPFA